MNDIKTGIITHGLETSLLTTMCILCSKRRARKLLGDRKNKKDYLCKAKANFKCFNLYCLSKCHI